MASQCWNSAAAPHMCVLCVVGTPHGGKLGGKWRPMSRTFALPYLVNQSTHYYSQHLASLSLY